MPPSTTTPPPAAAGTPAPAKALPSAVAEGKPYATVRQALLADGWLPLRDPECWSNIGGDAPVCNQLPEVESCSSDGYCNMDFADGARRLEVTTYGPYDRWNTPGQESALQVKSFELLPLPGADAAARCPSGDFDAFLKAFASDDGARLAFTAPLVKVAEIEDRGDEGYFPRMTYQTASAYRGFNVAYAGDAFHFVDGNGRRDPNPLSLKIGAPSPDRREVSYLYGMSEGNSYRFDLRDGCWRLTEDPRPPTP
ncbi:MAG: hypothetical protein ACTHOH_17240 [Lysobacteraceae bacterium]